MANFNRIDPGLENTPQLVSMNRLHNTGNGNQGREKRVLCCCSAGLLRSPTAAMVLGNQPWNFNTRAVGLIEDYALIPIDAALAFWADEFVCMDNMHRAILEDKLVEYSQDQVIGDITQKPIIVLDIPDRYQRMEPELQSLISQAYASQQG